SVNGRDAMETAVHRGDPPFLAVVVQPGPVLHIGAVVGFTPGRGQRLAAVNRYQAVGPIDSAVVGATAGGRAGTARWRTDRTAAGHPQTHVVAPYQLAVRVAAGYRTAQYVGIGGILKEDSMRSGVGNIHVIDGGTLAAGYAEETASGIAGVHTVDGYVRAIVIGYTEGGVAAAAIVVMPGHITHGAVAGIVQQQAAAATVGDGDVADGKAVDAVGLDAVTCGAVDVDVAADGQVARRSGRCVNPYPQAYRIIIVQVHGDVVQQDIGAAAKPYAVAGIAGDMQVSDGDVVAPVAIDRHDQFA